MLTLYEYLNSLLCSKIGGSSVLILSYSNVSIIIGRSVDISMASSDKLLVLFLCEYHNL